MTSQLRESIDTADYDPIRALFTAEVSMTMLPEQVRPFCSVCAHSQLCFISSELREDVPMIRRNCYRVCMAYATSKMSRRSLRRRDEQILQDVTLGLFLLDVILDDRWITPPQFA